MLLMAREASQGQASGHHAASATLLRRGNRALLLLGLAIASVMALGSPALARFLNVPADLLLAAAFGIPFGLALPLLLGELQGEQRFVSFSLLIAGQAGLKLIAAITLGLVFGPLGIIAGISVATIAIYMVALRLLRRRLAIKPNLPWWRPATQYLVVVLPSTLSLAVLLSADVLLVKHFFPTRAAGEYAAVAAIGRAIFWGASGVAAVLFPKAVFRIAEGKNESHIVSASLALVVIGGLVGLGLLSVASTWLLNSFAGDAYTSAAAYLPWYGLGMMMLGGVAVLIATFQSQGSSGFLAVLLPLTLAEPAVLITIMATHRSMLQVVQGLDVFMAVILVGLGVFYIVQVRLQHSASVPSIVKTPADQRVGELVLGQ
jgi:O-antigen/teichoic acid export membrane protein